MKFLDNNHWDTQYALSLKLYEMSAKLSCITGDTTVLHSCLIETISRVKSFEDSLTASSLLIKLLASQSKYKDATENCLSILSTLGEELPQDVSLAMVISELSVLQTTLKDITVEQVKALPRMIDKVGHSFLFVFL